ncbi:helix-turn-helix domain-containing protein [Nonomuraea sp. NPDC048882]|uniref:ArsR/SmtB family transcription factor n=1 Tax=Nonomuraea sp. NPDC048882 TaxID=3154347 RepID=UPI0034040D52
MSTDPVTHSPAAMKALASPLRREILRHLASHGPANSTTLAKAMGQNTGTTSYHLRLLADTGFVTELRERAKGRERWWDVVKADRRMPAREDLTDAEQDLAERLGDSRLAEDLRMLAAFVRDRDEDSDWQQGSRASTFMTKERLKEFHEEYLKLVHRFGSDRDDAPEGARMILLRWMGFPGPRGS